MLLIYGGMVKELFFYFEELPVKSGTVKKIFGIDMERP